MFFILNHLVTLANSLSSFGQMVTTTNGPNATTNVLNKKFTTFELKMRYLELHYEINALGQTQQTFVQISFRTRAINLTRQKEVQIVQVAFQAE